MSKNEPKKMTAQTPYSLREGDSNVEGLSCRYGCWSFGCAARMWLSNFLAQKYGPAFPIGTLVVNVFGCFII